MKALRYSGLPADRYLVIQDARTATPDYQGDTLEIRAGDVVPIEALPNAEWSGDLAGVHVARGWAEPIDTEGAAPEPVDQPQPTTTTTSEGDADGPDDHPNS